MLKEFEKTMNIAEAMRAVSEEYDAECIQARAVAAFNQEMKRVVGQEYAEIDRELPDYVADIARALGVPVGTFLPDYVYQMARMCFRLGMRVQRKLGHPGEATTLFWRNGGPQ